MRKALGSTFNHVVAEPVIPTEKPATCEVAYEITATLKAGEKQASLILLSRQAAIDLYHQLGQQLFTPQ